MIDRQKYNLEILGKLEGFLKEHPDFRFIQALWALGIIDRDENNLIIDRFYEEPKFKCTYTLLCQKYRNLIKERVKN